MEDERQEDERMRRRVVKTTGGDGCGATKDDAITSQGKLERLRLAVGRQERRRRTITILLPSERWNVSLTRFALLDFML